MTSIEWLIEEMLKKGFFKESVTLTNINHLQYKAEEIHQSEIEEAFYSGNNIPGNWEDDSTNYYNETYKRD